jgi:transcription elongation factor Elf1
MASTDMNGVEISDSQAADIRDTDIVFDCPHCGCNLAIDYRGAGLQINCSQCNKSVLVPIPDGMQLTDLDLNPGDILKQLFATRRNFQKAELQIQNLKAKLVTMQEALGAMQAVVAEGLAI